MKIALLTSTFYAYSGIDRVVERQAKAFALNGDSVTIFTLEADMKPPQHARLEILGMPKGLLWQRIYRLFFPLDFVKAIKWIPKLKSFDIVYSHQYPMNWLAYLAKRFYKVKYIYYNHGFAPTWTFSSFVERTYMKLVSTLANWTIKRASSAISVSQYLCQQLKKETGLDSEVIYNRIDTERFQKGMDGSKVRDKYKLGSAPVILYVGRISPHKGVHLLIEAFNLVKREIPNVELLIVGKHTFAGYSKKLRRMADDSVVFADYVPDEDVPLYYAACNVYATATLWEGFNLPLAEAQACGKPVVAFNLGPHPEVVRDGETGLLVAPGDVPELAKALLDVLGDRKLARRLGDTGADYALKNLGHYGD